MKKDKLQLMAEDIYSRDFFERYPFQEDFIEYMKKEWNCEVIRQHKNGTKSKRG